MSKKSNNSNIEIEKSAFESMDFSDKKKMLEEEFPDLEFGDMSEEEFNGYFNVKKSFEEEIGKEKIYLWKDHSGRGEKPVTLKESNIRKTWDLKELDDENQMLLSYFLDNSDEGDIWTSGTETLEHIETKEIEVKKRKKPIIKDTVDESLKSKLIGKTVGLDGEDPDSFHKIVDVDREIIEFDGEKSNNYKIVLDGEESYFIHPDAIQDFLNGEDTGAFLKSNYKGGTIMLIKNEVDKNKSLNSIKDEAIDLLDKLIEDTEYDTFGEYQNKIFERLKKEQGFNVEEDIDASDYLLKATSLESVKYILSTIIPKLRKMNSNRLLIEEQVKWLDNFIVKWDDAENNNDFLIEGRLQKEYDQFLMDNDLPELSADDLLLDLKKINSLVGKELVWVNPKTKIKVESDRKIIVESAGYNNKGDAFIIYGPSDGDINFLLKDEINKLINGDFGNSHDEASFILLDEYNKINKEEEKTPFNDPYEFIEEFSGYLVGKKIVNEKGEKFTILDLEYLNDLVVLRVESENGEQHPEHLEKYKAFIDGEIVPGHVGYVGESYSLILQEDVKAEEKINQPDYKYYVVNSKTNKIRTGWEYKEDADDAAKEEINYGQKDIAIFAKKTLKSMNIDPELNENWGSEVSDYSIIEEAVRFGVTEGDYDESWVSKYIDGYKNGKYNSVIKARLVYYLDHADKHFKGAITSSQIEKALKFKEIISRVSDELLRIIKKDA
jgi:hypothetical protein